VQVLVAGDTPDAPLTWMQLQSGVVVAQGVVHDGEAAAGLSGDCILVLPGFEAQLRVLESPARSALQARAAAAYLFKGALATSETDTCFAVGEPGDASGARLATAFARSRLSAWLARCAESHLTPRAIYLDCAIWPVESGSAHVIRLGNRTLVAAGALGGFTIESDLAPALLGPWLAQLGSAISSLRLSEWTPEQLSFSSNTATPRLMPGGAANPLHVLAVAAAAMPTRAPNLAQTTAEAGKDSRSQLAPSILAASLATIAGLTQIGVMALDGMRNAEAARTITNATETAFRVARPDVKRITNLRAQVTAAINGATRITANPVLVVSPSVTDMLVGHPDVQLDEIRHEAPSRAVSLRFSSMTPAELDAAIAALRQTSGRIEVGPMQVIDGRSSVAISMGAS
jgi:type II secretory pathway component PulL